MNHQLEIALAIGVLSPFVSFWLLVFFGPRLGKPLSGWVAVLLGMGVPLAMASYVLMQWLGFSPDQRAELTANAFRYHWAMLGTVPATVGVKLDSLTVAMFFMVTFIAFWIFVFSVGYMSGHSDEVAHRSKYWRFFAYLSLFGFSMLGLVVSSSLLFLFIFWELVGLCSYLLIGFYFDQPVPQYAQMKAFITNRVGDFGFLIGLMLVYFHLGTMDIDQAAANFAKQAADGTGIFASDFSLVGWSLATIMGIGLFCGAMGKSAQFPLHVWLPDAMAGPTPVSALIHAATMVAAGVYLVARVFPLMTPDALMFISTIGCLTLFLMALIAIVQTDIKKCLAYSTLSQLGYMIFGMGCGAWVAALFHLITHAFFKAMLFLGSGQVIEGCHHEQDMRKMGGLLKKMPVTGFTFLIGVLAIAGFGLPGVSIGDKDHPIKFGLGGFFSKDEILAVAYARSHEWKDAKDFVDPHHDAAGGHATQSEPGAPATGHVTEPASARAIAPNVSLVSHHHSNCGGPINQGFLIPRNFFRMLGIELPPAETVIGHNVSQPYVPVATSTVILASSRVDDPPNDKKELPGEKVKQGGALKDNQRHEASSLASVRRPNEHAHSPGDSKFTQTKALPKWMFWLAIATAYITPFYMMRAWWLTFMGKPRDHHVYDHAHESPLMYIPLVVLAVGTFVSSYFLFRPLILDASHAAASAPLVMAIDGESHAPAIHHAHHWLIYGVGFAFVVGFAIAIAIYFKGLAIAEALKRAFGPLHTLLENKYYIDELYHLVFVKGCVLLAHVARALDTYLVDLIFDTLALLVERFAAFSGFVLDAQGVDGVFNGVSKSTFDMANAVRQPQTGKIRNYILFAAGAATVVLIIVLVWTRDGAGSAVALAAG